MIIVSACLAGLACRYDCQAKENSAITQLVETGQAIPLCPEQMGGLPTPRPCAEQSGEKVLTIAGNDVTPEFILGAREAFKLTELVNCKKAYLKSKSPMCGKDLIYNGQFNGNLIKGNGIFTQLILKAGIFVESID